MELCKQFILKILNGFSGHKEMHKYTLIQPSLNQKLFIDDIIAKQDNNIE